MSGSGSPNWPTGLRNCKARLTFHELLNGSGCPNHLTGKMIPTDVRILAILGIFDALVADDRPYKPGVPVKKALSILGSGRASWTQT